MLRAVRSGDAARTKELLAEINLPIQRLQYLARIGRIGGAEGAPVVEELRKTWVDYAPDPVAAFDGLKSDAEIRQRSDDYFAVIASFGAPGTSATDSLLAALALRVDAWADAGYGSAAATAACEMAAALRRAPNDQERSSRFFARGVELASHARAMSVLPSDPIATGRCARHLREAGRQDEARTLLNRTIDAYQQQRNGPPYRKMPGSQLLTVALAYAEAENGPLDMREFDALGP
jgi:hypothetical protein